MRLYLTVIVSVIILATCYGRNGGENSSNPKKGKTGESKYANAPVSLDAAIFEERDGDLPKDPGAAGKKDLAGIDSDNDGLRDDVQIYLAKNHADSARERHALRQYAIYLTKAIEYHGDEMNGTTFIAKSIDANLCYQGVATKDIAVTHQAKKDLYKVIMNTWKRTHAYLDVSKRLSGTISWFGSDEDLKRRCEFDYEKMEN